MNIGYGEVYFQTGYDSSPAPDGKHLMSVFGQYGPYLLDGTTWDSERETVARQFIDLIATFAPDIESCLEHVRYLPGRIRTVCLSPQVSPSSFR